MLSPGTLEVSVLRSVSIGVRVTKTFVGGRWLCCVRLVRGILGGGRKGGDWALVAFGDEVRRLRVRPSRVRGESVEVVTVRVVTLSDSS